MGGSGADLHAARAAFSRREWSTARRLFLGAAAQVELTADDLAALADAAWWLGLIDESLATSERLYRQRLRDGSDRGAALTAIEIGYNELLRGRGAIASGWFSRARRILEDHKDSVEFGYLLLIDVTVALETGDVEAARSLATRMAAIAARHEHATLAALACFTEGSILIREADVVDGLAMLDEAMLVVVAGELDPAWAGNLYCQMMSFCHELGDLDRARQWTTATLRWCDRFEDAVMFGGICRLHRVQLMQAEGDWAGAESGARQVCRELANMNTEVVAEGHYILGELMLDRGNLAAAGEAFDLAQSLGRPPYPGLALLRRHEGRIDDACAAIDVALAEAGGDELARAPLLAAAAEIALSAEHLDDSATVIDELRMIASRFRSPRWTASAQLWRGCHLLGRGLHREALNVLSGALDTWRQLRIPMEVARTRLEIARVADAMGDRERAARERELATSALDELGANRLLTTLYSRPEARHTSDPLSERELEVLRAVARGMTNRAVADELFISRRTVDRHLENIYSKLGVTGRAAAVAWAAEHHLLVGGAR